MQKIKRIAELKNAAEADLLSGILNEEDIPHYIKTTSELAYDGLFEIQQGWGFIEAPESYEKQILELIEEFRNQ